MKNAVGKLCIFFLMVIELALWTESFAQPEKCFGACWGLTQVQPAYRISIEAIKVNNGVDAVGAFTQLMIGDAPMRWIPGHYAEDIRSFIQSLAQKEIAFVDIQQYSGGGYRLIGRFYDQRCVGGILIDPCNLANRDKPLRKMKTNRDQKRRNEGCEWATGKKPLRKMKTNRDRENEGCEWAKGGKPRKKMRTNRDRDNEGCEWAKDKKSLKKTKTNRDRDNEGCEWAKGKKSLKKTKTNRNRDNKGCSETLGKKKRKTKPSQQKSSGCDLAKPGGKGKYGGRRRPEKSPCYD